MLEALRNLAEQPLAAGLILAGGVAALLAGGNWLVHGSVKIARRLGMSTLLIGLTLVAFGTSSPELFFNVIAALGDHGELSFGNVVGSNIANLGLILGVTALFRPLAVHGRIISKELPWLLVVSVGMVVLAMLPPEAAPGREGFGRIDGAILVACFAFFMIGWYRMGRRDKADPLVKELGAEARAEAGGPMAVAVLLVVGGLAGLVAGGKLTEIGAIGLARWLGFSDALIGLTVVAVATSLPELATSIIAVRKGHDDLAVGNLVGSNMFNIVLVLGLTTIAAPVALPPRGFADLGTMILLTCLLFPIALTNRKVTRAEGAMLLAIYLAYMGWSVWMEVG